MLSSWVHDKQVYELSFRFEKNIHIVGDVWNKMNRE